MDSERELAAADRVMRTLGEPTAAPFDPQREIDRARVQRALFGDDEVELPCVGHYQLVEAIGEGAMGEVYRAYDTVLQRDVAIKIVHRALLGHGSGGAARLLHEARSLARTSHPNVVAVYETGVDEHGRAWIAMELVDGSNLRQWLRECERRLDEIVDVLVQAGRGLAAAHAAGLVHRDFKPDNVLVDRAGRVRVGDFGVVRPSGDGLTDRMAGATDGSSSDAALARTRPGALVGTVAYMSPEQLAGEAIDHCSDQFSFCVTAWEALWGVRPFTGTDPTTLRAAILGDEPRKPRASRRVPLRIERALRRGLSIHRADRYAALDPLLRALEPPRRLPAIVAVSALLGAGAVAIPTVLSPPAQECSDAAAQLAGVWDDAIAERVRIEVGRMSVAYADTVAETAVGELSARASAWRDAWQRACEARVDSTESVAQTDRVMACLWSRRADLGAVTGTLLVPDDRMMEHVVDGVAALPDPQQCLLVSSAVAVPSAPVRARLDGLIATARSLRVAGEHEAALPLVQLAAFVAETDDARGYAIDALRESAELRSELGYYERAVTDAVAAVDAAIATGDDEQMARGWVWLARVAANGLRDPKRATLWLGHADSAVARLAPASETLRLSLALARISVTAMHDPVAALDLADELERSTIPGDGTQHDIVRMAREVGASLAFELGRFDEAARRYRALVAEHADRYGDEHPRTADVWYGLGIALDRQGSDEAESVYRRVLAIRERSLHATHRDVGAIHIALANVVLRARRHDEASGHVAAARRIYEVVLEPDDPAFAELWTAEGVVMHRRGELAEAAVAHDRARQIYERAFGAESLYAALARSNAAEARLSSGEQGQAAELEAAARVIADNCGADCAYLGYPHKALGLVALDEGRCGAVELLASAHAKLATIDEQDAREAADALARARARGSDCRE